MDTHTPFVQPDFKMTLRFTAPAEKLYTALTTLTGLKAWWTRFCELDNKVSGKAEFHFPNAGFFAIMQIQQLQPFTYVEWKCVDSKHNDNTSYKDLHDWIGTDICFKITALNNTHSQLDFTHCRLTQLECFESCRSGWNFFLNESLRGYLEDGVGQPWS